MNRHLDRDWDHNVIRYPEPAIEVIDPAFQKYVVGSAALERLWTGARWNEGPVWRWAVSRLERHSQQPHVTLDGRDGGRQCIPRSIE